MSATPFEPKHPEPANPYAPPVAPIGEAPAGPVGDLAGAEATRRKYLNHEANVLSLGSLHYLGAVFLILGFFGGLAALVMSLRDGPDGPDRGFATILAAYALTALANAALGAGLRRFKPWARWAEAGVVGLLLAASVAVPLMVPLLLVGSVPAWFVLGYALYLMLSRKAAVVFSPEYQEVVARTPQVRFRTGWLAWCLLLLFLFALVAASIVYSALGTRGLVRGGRQAPARSGHSFGFASVASSETTSGVCQSRDPSSLETILPSGAIRNVAGMPWVANTSGTPEARSTVIGHPLPSRNRLTVPESPSVETQTKDTYFILGSAASEAIEGISRTHGGHHVAQTLRKTAFPL